MYILASTESDYEVNIYLKYSRSNQPLESWVLQAVSASQVKGYAIDTLASMCPDEIFNSDDELNSFINTHHTSSYTPIGYDLAKNYFTYKIYKV